MRLEDYNTPEEKLKFLTETREGKEELKEIQGLISKISLKAIDSSEQYKQVIEGLKMRGIVVNVGISIAVGVTGHEEGKTDQGFSDDEYLNSIGLSWRADEEGKKDKE